MSFRPSLRPSLRFISAAPTEWISVKSGIEGLYENLSRNFEIV